MKTQSKSTIPFRAPLAVVAACLAAQCAQAQLFQEGFNYTPGSTLGGNVNPGSGVAWGPGGSTTLQIGSSQLTYSGLQELPGYDLQYTSGVTASSDVNTYTAVTSGNIFYSFLLDCTTLPTANNYISALNAGTTGPGGGTDLLSLYVGASGTGYKVGVRTTGGGTGAAYASTVLQLNTTYLVVGELTLGSAPVANLYLDPTPGAAQPAASATQTTTTAIASVDDVGIKSQSSASAGDFFIGNVQIGTTWDSVTEAEPVPEPGTLALAAVGLLGWALHYRRTRG
jgi:hypothetical protein